MTLRQFKRLLAVYGADLGRWPEDRRRAAWRLLKSSPAAEQQYQQIRALERMLDLWTVPPSGSALIARITAQARHLPQHQPPVSGPQSVGAEGMRPASTGRYSSLHTPLSRSSPTLWQSGLMLGLALLLGLFLGLGNWMETPSGASQTDVLGFIILPADRLAGL